jgi:hypothetical protein
MYISRNVWFVYLFFFKSKKKKLHKKFGLANSEDGPSPPNTQPDGKLKFKPNTIDGTSPARHVSYSHNLFLTGQMDEPSLDQLQVGPSPQGAMNTKLVGLGNLRSAATRSSPPRRRGRKNFSSCRTWSSPQGCGSCPSQRRRRFEVVDPCGRRRAQPFFRRGPCPARLR